tara:strand:- start:305 stop:1120 length:816 start_codon:yes stop_codon:yes gene_type:complete
MARRIQPIFDTILSDTRCQGSSRSFVESLQKQYTSKKTLSPGQRSALGRIEEQLTAAPTSIDPKQESFLDDLIYRANKACDEWSVDFATSVKGQLLMGRELSSRQKEILIKLADRHSDASIAQRDCWTANFTSEMRQKMKIAAGYYLANPPYFGELARNAIDNDLFIPSEKAYRKMVENKYASRVIESSLAEAKFKAGSHVMLRSTAHSSVSFYSSDKGVTSRKGKLGMVVKPDAKPVSNAARGSKIYSVLFFGEKGAVTVEERWLKKGKA